MTTTTMSAETRVETKLTTLEDYLSQEVLSLRQKELIQTAVLAKENILIAGGTGTGKTTFANAILNEIARTGDEAGPAGASARFNQPSSLIFPGVPDSMKS